MIRSIWCLWTILCPFFFLYGVSSSTGEKEKERTGFISFFIYAFFFFFVSGWNFIFVLVKFRSLFANLVCISLMVQCLNGYILSVSEFGWPLRSDSLRRLLLYQVDVFLRESPGLSKQQLPKLRGSWLPIHCRAFPSRNLS